METGGSQYLDAPGRKKNPPINGGIRSFVHAKVPGRFNIHIQAPRRSVQRSAMRCTAEQQNAKEERATRRFGEGRDTVSTGTGGGAAHCGQNWSNIGGPSLEYRGEICVTLCQPSLPERLEGPNLKNLNCKHRFGPPRQHTKESVNWCVQSAIQTEMDRRNGLEAIQKRCRGRKKSLSPGARLCVHRNDKSPTGAK